MQLLESFKCILTGFDGDLKGGRRLVADDVGRAQPQAESIATHRPQRGNPMLLGKYMGV